eukprot:Partr_v1_DN28312_c2_g1_i2_m79137 putative NA
MMWWLTDSCGSTVTATGAESVIFSDTLPDTFDGQVLLLSIHSIFFIKLEGCDLFNTIHDPSGRREMVVVETNSCPSGQKSMPPPPSTSDSGYHSVIERAFSDSVMNAALPFGHLAVIYDKNEMEAGGYAHALATHYKEAVYLVQFGVGDNAAVTWRQGLLMIRHHGDWFPIRACFRYVTQKPWTRIPLFSRTLVFNCILTCLAGGRNKLMASIAYDEFNQEQSRLHSGLCIQYPQTFVNVAKPMVPAIVNQMSGIYTATCASEVDAFMRESHSYGRFIVQAMVGNRSWSNQSGRYHVGTVCFSHLSSHLILFRKVSQY